MTGPESEILGSATRHGSSLRIVLQLQREFPVGQVNVVLFAHDEVATYWCAAIPPTQQGDELIAEVSVDPGWGPLIEIRAITVSVEHSAHRHEFVGGRDFKKTYLALSDDGMVVAGAEAEDALSRIESARRARYESPIGSGPKQYRAVLIAEGVLLTQNHRVPGISLLRLEKSTRGSDLEVIVNSALHQLGFGIQIDRGFWVQQYTERKPTLILSIPDIRAGSADEAARFGLQAADRLLAILSMQRDSAGSLIGGIVESKVPPPESATWLGVPPYRGNLIGGFISGESPHDILKRYEWLSSNPRAELWLSLHRDALSETRWDFRFFRHFNLLETIAREVVGEKSPVIDFGSVPVTQSGKPATTGTARGKVYELIRRWCHVAKVAERAVCTQSSDGVLWNEVGVWVGIRDAVAHDGGYRPDSGTRITSAKRVEAAFKRARESGQRQVPEVAYGSRIQEATKLVVGAFLDGRMV